MRTKNWRVRAVRLGAVMTAIAFGLESMVPGPDRPFPLVWGLLGLAVITTAMVYFVVLNPARFLKEVETKDGMPVRKEALIESLGRLATAFVLVPLTYGFIAYAMSGNPIFYLLFVLVSLGTGIAYSRRLKAVANSIPDVQLGARME